MQPSNHRARPFTALAVALLTTVFLMPSTALAQPAAPHVAPSGDGTSALVTPPTHRALYRDASASIDDRVDDLLARMTVEEKVGQMTQLTLAALTLSRPTEAAGPTAMGGSDGAANEYEEWMLDPVKLREALVDHHLGSVLNVGSHGYDVSIWRGIIEEVQRMATEETRLGIPILYGVDAVHGANYVTGSTLFPQNLALASAFDRESARVAGAVTARETGTTGVPWNFAPVLDVGRNPMWSRYYETYGEDVYLTTELALATIDGYQHGMDGSRDDVMTDWYTVAACAKHFIGYSGSRFGKDRISAHIPMRELRERYLPPFRAAVDAGIRTFMINSGDVNGEAVHASRYLLTDLLRGELGFEGLVVTDWEDIIKLETVHRVAENEREATKMSVEAGIDMSMVPMRLSFYDHLLSLVQDGEIGEARLDESVRRILALKFELGLFENPFPPDLEDPSAEIRTAEAQAANLKATRRSVVMLKNEAGVLPLRRSQRILVTGPTANSLLPLNGGWTYTWQGADDTYKEFYPDIDHLLGAIENHAETVTYVQGATLDQEQNLDAVTSAAQNHDVIVVALGEGPYAEKVGDIGTLDLPEAQQQLLETALSTGKPVVLVMIEGRPRLARSMDDAPALVAAFQPGNQGGRAIAEVLFGEVNPSGRMPFSYPREAGNQMPYDHEAAAMTGAQYAGNGKVGGYNPLYPFGHGLSYTTFAYSDLTLASATVGRDDTIMASVTVTNTGGRAGEHSVLVFTRDLVASLTPDARRLREFGRVSLAAGASTTISFEIPVSALAFTGLDGQPVLEAGAFEVHVGDQMAAFTLTD